MNFKAKYNYMMGAGVVFVAFCFLITKNSSSKFHSSQMNQPQGQKFAPEKLNASAGPKKSLKQSAFNSKPSRKESQENLNSYLRQPGPRAHLRMVAQKAVGATHSHQTHPYQNQIQENRHSSANAASIFDHSDLPLLEQTAQKTREEGSRVAYIGRAPDLYSFDPQFFKPVRSDQGEQVLMPNKIVSMETDGDSKFIVQRVPYPIPGDQIDYEILSRAIIRAADDGATLINIASSGVDRHSIESSIQYARNRGIAVVMVSPVFE